MSEVHGASSRSRAALDARRAIETLRRTNARLLQEIQMRQTSFVENEKEIAELVAQFPEAGR